MNSLLQSLGLNSIIMEPTPLLERISGKRMIFRSVPKEHFRVIRQTNTLTERLHRLRRLIKHVIGINDTDFDVRFTLSITAQLRTGRHAGPDQTGLAKVVEVPTQLVVPGLQRVVVVEPGHVVQRRNCASQIRRHAVVRVADEEGPVEFLLEFPGHHRWVAGFRGRVVRIGLLVGSVGVTIDTVGGTVGLVTVDAVGVANTIHAIRGSVHPVGVAVGVGAVDTVHTIHTICMVAVSPDTALKPQKRRGGTGGLTTRWKQVVIDVLDENSFSLLQGKHSLSKSDSIPPGGSPWLSGHPEQVRFTV